MNNLEILTLFEQWNDAIKTGSVKNVVALYDNNALLLPTISDKPCHNHEEISAYFTDFLTRQPTGVINESNIEIFDHIAINSGLYTFSFKDDKTVKARFTFIYRWNGKRWLILHHHSSQMPESIWN